MNSWKNKYLFFSSVGKITFILVILLNVMAFSSCSSSQTITQEEKSRKLKNKISKKKKRKYERARKKFIKKNYNRQPEKTKKQIDALAEESKNWRESHFNSQKPPFFQRVKIWFKKLIGIFKKREKGLFEEDVY